MVFRGVSHYLLQRYKLFKDFDFVVALKVKDFDKKFKKKKFLTYCLLYCKIELRFKDSF